MRVLILLALCGALGVSSLEEDHNLHLRTGSVPIPLHPLRASDHAHKIAHLLAVDHAEPKQYAVHVDSSVSIVRDMDLAARLEQAAGTRVIHYLPTDNFLMLLSSEQVRQVASLPEVLSVVDFLPEYKVDPALTDSVHGLHMLSEVTPASSPARKQMASLRERLLGSSVETHLDMESLRRSKESLHPNVRVNGMRKIQASLLPNMVSAKHSALLVKDWTAAWQANYQQQRDDLVIYTATPNVVRLMVHEATMPAALEFLSKHPWVQWVEETPELRMMNDEAAPTLQTGTTSRTPDTNVKIWTKGIKGAGEIIGVGRHHLCCMFVIWGVSTVPSFVGQATLDWIPPTASSQTQWRSRLCNATLASSATSTLLRTPSRPQPVPSRRTMCALYRPLTGMLAVSYHLTELGETQCLTAFQTPCANQENCIVLDLCGQSRQFRWYRIYACPLFVSSDELLTLCLHTRTQGMALTCAAPWLVIQAPLVWLISRAWHPLPASRLLI